MTIRALPKDPRKAPPRALRRDIPKERGLAVDTHHPLGEDRAPPPMLQAGTRTTGKVKAGTKRTLEAKVGTSRAVEAKLVGVRTQTSGVTSAG